MFDTVNSKRSKDPNLQKRFSSQQDPPTQLTNLVEQKPRQQNPFVHKRPKTIKETRKVL